MHIRADVNSGNESLSKMADLQTRIYTWRHGRHVGDDTYGNRYYEHKSGERKRWVIYKGTPEASKVPPYWNAWLHYTTDEVPAKDFERRDWEAPHQPNLTGTRNAYRPSGHVTRGGERAKATGDYSAWSPEN